MFRRRCAMWTDAALIPICAAILLLVLLLPPAAAAGAPYTAQERALLEAYESGQIIRLHVLADGDDAESQRVKLLVRDALLGAFGGMLSEAAETDADAVYAALQSHVDEMERAARECALANGFEGSVTAEVGTLHLPAKTYGRVTLPEGSYRALRVTLGSGQGRNWWCVLFPRLCLAASGEEAEKSSQPLRLTWDAERIFSQWLIFPV